MVAVTTYIDFGSPYSYLAWHRMTRHAVRYGDADVRFVLVSAGHIFRAEGGKPNASYPNMLRYNRLDLARWAKAYDCPLTIPDSFPTRTLEAARVAFALEARGDARRDAWIAGCFHAHWTRNLDLADPAVLDQVGRDVGLDDVAALVADPDAKAAVTAATQKAYDAGAPGVPFFVVDGDVYWGNDRLDWVEARLSGQDAPAW